jgi:hypothetical protein
MDRRPQSRFPDVRHHGVASDVGGERAAAIYTLVESAKLNGLAPEAYRRRVLGTIADHPIKRIAELLPCAQAERSAVRAAA